MKRSQFLKTLQKLWQKNGEMNDPLTIEDLLDDAAYIDVVGASEMYGILLEDELERQQAVKDISPETGNVIR